MISKNLFSLTGKTVVVTGASGGLANAVCKAIVRAGARNIALIDYPQPAPSSAVMLEAALRPIVEQMYNQYDRIIKAQKKFQQTKTNRISEVKDDKDPAKSKTGGTTSSNGAKPNEIPEGPKPTPLTVSTWLCDISDQATVSKTMKAIKAYHNDTPLSVLINTAGYCENISAVDYPEKQLKRLLEVNLAGSMIIATEFAKAVIEQNPLQDKDKEQSPVPKQEKKIAEFINENLESSSSISSSTLENANGTVTNAEQNQPRPLENNSSKVATENSGETSTNLNGESESSSHLKTNHAKEASPTVDANTSSEKPENNEATSQPTKEAKNNGSPSAKNNASIKNAYLLPEIKSMELASQANTPLTTRASIILIASMSGSIVNYPQPQAAYNMSKAGVIHLAKSLASEWAPYGIRVNSLSPGYILTPLTKKIFEKRKGSKLDGIFDLKTQWEMKIPMGRMALPEEVAEPIVFMASDASSYMTGSDLIIDGGYTVR